MKKTILLSILALALAVAAGGVADAAKTDKVPKKIKQTVSGRPEALFVGEKVPQVKKKIIADQAASELVLTKSGANYLEFSPKASPKASKEAEAAVQTDQVLPASGAWFAKYLFVPRDKDTFVTVHLYDEIIDPLGKRVSERQNNNDFNFFQQRLFDLGGQ